MDCAFYSKLCKKLLVQNYPTFYWFNDGEIVDAIPEERTAKELLKFAINKTGTRSKREVLESKINNVDISSIPEIYGKDFQSKISNGITLVTFCVPWCSHCQKALSEMVELQNFFSENTTVSICKLDCSNEVQNGDICFTELDNGVPTINLYFNGELIVSDYGGISFHELKDMIIGNTGSAVDLADWKIKEKAAKKLRKVEKSQTQHK